MTDTDDITHTQVILVPQQRRPSALILFARRLLRTLERKFWIVLIGAVLGFGIAHAVNEFSTPLFKVSSVWRINVAPDPSTADYHRRSGLDIHWPRIARDLLNERLGANAVWEELGRRPEIAAALTENSTVSQDSALTTLRQRLELDFNPVTDTLTLKLTGRNAALVREAANLLPALAFDESVARRSSLVHRHRFTPASHARQEIHFAHLTAGALEASDISADPQRAALEKLLHNSDAWPGGIANPSVRAQYNKLAQAKARKETLTKSYQLPPDELKRLNADIDSARARVAGEARAALKRLEKTPPATAVTAATKAKTQIPPTAPVTTVKPSPATPLRRENLAGSASPVVATPDKPERAASSPVQPSPSPSVKATVAAVKPPAQSMPEPPTTAVTDASVTPPLTVPLKPVIAATKPPARVPVPSVNDLVTVQPGQESSYCRDNCLAGMNGYEPGRMAGPILRLKPGTPRERLHDLFFPAVATAIPGDADFSFGTILAVPVRAAQMPALPFSPDRRRNLIFGMALGLALGLMTAMLATMSDEKIATPGDIKWGFDVPVVGVMPLF